MAHENDEDDALLQEPFDEDGDEEDEGLDDVVDKGSAEQDWDDAVKVLRRVAPGGADETAEAEGYQGLRHRGARRGQPSWDAESEPEEQSTPFFAVCLRVSVVLLLVLAVAGSYLLYGWYHPQPVSCTVDLVRPQKFKIDVTDFFTPRVSAALQLVLSLDNRNMLRSMLLEQCKLTVFDAETGLKLGTSQQNSLVLDPFKRTAVTVTMPGLAGSLPPPEQRRLAGTFLGKKALLLTVVATASSRLPVKGSRPASVSTNSTRRIDFSALVKEPFFQRQPQPAVEEPSTP